MGCFRITTFPKNLSSNETHRTVLVVLIFSPYLSELVFSVVSYDLYAY